MKSETSCGELCQHPECWRANLRRVKEAVRARNGIKSTETEEEKVSGSVTERKKDLEDGSLPTLKVIDLFDGTNQRTGSAPHNSSLRPSPFHYRSSSLPSLSPDQSLPQSTSCTPTFHAPRPSPASPPVMTGYQKRMQWKKRVQAVEESDDKRCGSGQLSIVGVHEMYDDEEWSQDWRDVYITSAYLIWCQTKKRKRRKAKSTGSLASRKDPRKVAFKDVTEEMLPAEMEKLKPKRSEPRRSPTVGQPFSPSRLSSHKKVHVQHLDLALYGLDELKDFPTSVLAGIIQHLKPKNVGVDQDLPLGLDLRLKQQSSVRSMVHGANHRTTDDATGKKLEQALRDERSRVLLDIDINSHLTSPEEEEKITTEGRGAEELCHSEDDEVLAKQEPSLGNVVEQSLVTKQGRVPLALASVGVPTDHARKSQVHHCTNSIPRNQELGIAMEPVDLVPATATPTPTGTPAEGAGIPGFQLCTQAHSSLEVNLASEHVSPADDRLNRYWPVRGHMTSALRHSPFPVRAPAPTPISPEKWERYSRSSHTRERSKTCSSESPRRLKRWETLSNVYDRQETGEEITLVPRGSPEGEAEEVGVEPVFLTEGVLPRDPNLFLLSSRKAVGEWPQNKMIINVIENEDQESRTIRSPSPGSKTCIPQDILAEFHGDLYGRKQIRVAGQKFTGKPNIVTQPQMSTEYPGYIAAGWRPPRSRTPLQFLETPSRKAPKPLRQPPADRVPKSLTVQPLSTGVRRRPKSTPPRLTSPGSEAAVQQVLSDSSLASAARDDLVALSMAAHAPSPSTDRGGSIPPPPSPEVPLNGAVSSRLDPVSEAEESSGAAEEAGGGVAAASLSVVEERNEEDEATVQLLHSAEGGDAEVSNESKDEFQFQATASERQLRSQNQAPQSVISEQGVLFSTTNERPVANDEDLPLNENTSDRNTDAQAQAHGESAETKQGFQEAGLKEGETNEKPDESRDIETADPPQPPGSPDLVNTPDFTEGVDLSLDLEAELRAAMEGLDDMDDLGGTGERRPSLDLND